VKLKTSQKFYTWLSNNTSGLRFVGICCNILTKMVL